MKTMVCPNCGATLTIDENNEYGVCEYCGTKVRVDDVRTTNIIVDEAEVRRAEHEKEIRMKELEMQEEQTKETRKNHKRIQYVVGGIVATVLLFVGVRGIFFNDFFTPIALFTMGMPVLTMGGIVWFLTQPRRMARTMPSSEEGILYPMGAIGDFKYKDYHEVDAILRQSGFTNIICVNAHDTFFNFSSYEGVSNIFVNGSIVTPFGNNVFPADTPIVVRYHGK